MRALHHLELASQLDRSGIGTSVDHQREALERAGIEYVTSPWVGGSLVEATSNIRQGETAFTDYDLAHCNMIGPMSAAITSHARRTDRPLVLHSHVTREDFRESFRGSNYAARPLGRYLRWFYSRADLVLCPSEYTRGILADYPIEAPIRPITNGVGLGSLEGHEKYRKEYRERYDLDGMVVFAVGNVFERKGLTDFCRLARRTEFPFVWFGHYDTGPLASRTVRKWTTYPPENVTFTGWVEDIRGAYGAGDVYLFPTKAENQGIVVLEAMACGKAVVLRDLPVFHEFYTDGVDCLMCETLAEFEAALTRLSDDPELRERLGKNAKETAAAHSLDRVADELSTVYEHVLAGEPEAAVRAYDEDV